jgi:ABC-type phosphate transport system substrate-binding protein
MRKIFGALILAVLASCGKPADTSPTVPGDGVVVYGRENNSGTYMYFKEHVLNEVDFAATVQTLPGTAAVINAVSKDKRSIGYGGIGYLKGVRALKVKKDASSPGVEPTLDAVVKGEYPISRYLYFYTIGEPDGALKSFIEWVRGGEGQKVCSEVGYYPLPEDKRSKSAPGASGKATITIKGSDTMVILGQRWAEHYMRVHPETVVQITGGGSGTGIAALVNGATNICQSSRPIKDKEKAQIKEKHGKEPVEFAVAMDGIAVFVHELNPMREIDLAQLKRVYTGKAKTWGDLGLK